MPHAKLPSRVEDAWEGGLIINPPRPVHAVSCTAGRVVAGGRELYLLRAGTQSLLARELPDLVAGDVLAVAAEPTPPWRVALATESGGVLMFEQAPGAPVIWMGREAPSSDARATHLVWDRGGLHARWSDGMFSRISGRGEGRYVVSTAAGLGFIDALATDGRGALVGMSLTPSRIIRFQNSGACDVTELPLDLPEGSRLWLAVAADAVAFSIERLGTYRGDGGVYTHCEAHVGGGAIAFHGSSARAALLGAMTTGDVSSIVRMGADGSAQRICEMVAVDGPPAEMSALAWDESRATLWGASPAAGLVRHTPRAARKARRPLS